MGKLGDSLAPPHAGQSDFPKRNAIGTQLLHNWNRMMPIQSNLPVVIVLLALTGSSTTASPVSYFFEGIVTNVVDEFNDFRGLIKVGDEFLGNYVFDHEAVDTNDADGFGRYYSAISSLNLTAGNARLDWDAGGSRITVVNEALEGGDFYQVIAGVLWDSHHLGFVLGLADDDGSLLDSDRLLSTPPSLMNADYYSVRVGFQSSGINFEGELTNLSNIPEPSTLILLGAAGIACIPKLRRVPYGTRL